MKASLNAMFVRLGTSTMGTCILVHYSKQVCVRDRNQHSGIPYTVWQFIRRSVTRIYCTHKSTACRMMRWQMVFQPARDDEAACRSFNGFHECASDCTRETRCAHTTLSCSRRGTRAGGFWREGLCDCYATWDGVGFGRHCWSCRQ